MQSQLTLARANLARSETLLASQAVSKAEYDANKAAATRFLDSLRLAQTRQ